MAGGLEGLVTHKFVEINGIKLHYVEAGSGPTVLCLHGFPDFWYGYRHQIPPLITAGFHVVVPDLPGFGDTDTLPPEKCSSVHVVGILVGLLDTLQIKQVIVIGHDWGAGFGANLTLFRPDLVKALVLLSVPYYPRGAQSTLEFMAEHFSKDLYILIFQEPGVAEKIFAMAKNEDIFSAFLLRWDDSQDLSIPPFIPDEPLPDWLTKEDLKAYAGAVEKSGWTGGLNHYRAASKSWELTAPWFKASIPKQVPVMYAIGKRDITMRLRRETIYDGEAFTEASRPLVLGLKVTHFVDAAHFLHQEKPKEVNKYILDFLQQYAA